MLASRLSLRVLLPMVIGLFALGIGVIAYGNTYQLLNQKISEQARFDTRQQLTLAQGVIETFLRDGNTEAAARLVASFGSDGSTRLAILVDEQDRIIGSTRLSDLGHSVAERRYSPNQAIISAVRQTGGIETAIDEENDTVSGVVSVCGGSASGTLRPVQCGYLFLDKRRSYFASPVQEALKQQSLQAGFGLVAAGFLMWLLLHAIVTRRTNTIVDAVDQFAHGNREARTGLRGGDEIARIGIAVDRLLPHIVENEMRLRDDEALLTTILDGVAEGIITFDNSGELLSFNAGAERIFGYQAGEVLGQNIEVLLETGEELKALLNPMTLPPDSETSTVEVSCRHHNGDELDIEWRLRPAAFGNRPIIIALVRNIAEARKLAAMQTEFTSVVSHELRTPLTSLHGSLRMLTSGVLAAAPEQAEQLLLVAERNSRRLLNLVNDILDVQKLGMESLRLDIGRFDLAEVAQKCIESNASYFERYGVHSRIDIDATDTCIEGDEFRIEQVITNLLSNAIKYSPRNSTVILTIEDEDNDLRLTVADHGRGIPESFRERIFEPFFQVDSSDAREKEGTGLGLSICQSIVRKHGGRLDFESQPDQGTRFFFVIPREARETGDSEYDSTSGR